MHMGVAFATMPAPTLLVIKKGKYPHTSCRTSFCGMATAAFVFAFFESTVDANGRPRFDMSCVGSLPAEVNPVATCD